MNTDWMAEVMKGIVVATLSTVMSIPYSVGALIALMTIDFFAGFGKSLKIDSETGHSTYDGKVARNGIITKLQTLLMIGAVNVVMVALQRDGHLPIGDWIGTVVTLWLCVTETLSVCKNTGAGPAFLTRALTKLQHTIEDEGEAMVGRDSDTTQQQPPTVTPLKTRVTEEGTKTVMPTTVPPVG